MADFCFQCSIKNFDHDYGDLAGISDEEATKHGMFPVVICEGCGEIQVDHLGRCVSNCLEHHKRYTND